MNLAKKVLALAVSVGILAAIGVSNFLAGASTLQYPVAPLDRTGWSAEFVSTNSGVLYNDPVENADNMLRPLGVPSIAKDSDGVMNTVADSMWIGNPIDDDYYEVDMKNTYTISEADAKMGTVPGLLELYVSTDGTNFTQVVTDFDPTTVTAASDGTATDALECGAVDARYIRLQLEATGAGFWFNLCDLKVLGQTDKLDRTGWTASYVSTNDGVLYNDTAEHAGNMLRPLGVPDIISHDDGTKTIETMMWIANTIDDDYYQVDMLKANQIDGVEVQLQNLPGYVDIDVSTDGTTYTRVATNVDPATLTADNLGYLKISFSAVSARYVRFVVDAMGSGFWLGMGQFQVLTPQVEIADSSSSALNTSSTTNAVSSSATTSQMTSPKTGDNAMTVMLAAALLAGAGVFAVRTLNKK